MSEQFQRHEINRRASADPQRFAWEESNRYTEQLVALADRLSTTGEKRQMVMLAGPSCAGKTTTANRLENLLKARDTEAFTVSLDDFYFGNGVAPLLPDGSPDYESPEALNLPLLAQCLRDLTEDGETELPIFDFLTRSVSKQTRHLKVHDHSVVIFEGLHALNPLVGGQLKTGKLFRLYINTLSPIYDGEEKLLCRRQLRLARRMIRDVYRRSSPFEETMEMWPRVERGEQLYLFPYADTADMVINTTHACEPCMMAERLLPLLQGVPLTDVAQRMVRALSLFEPLSPNLFPDDSLMWEFFEKEKG